MFFYFFSPPLSEFPLLIHFCIPELRNSLSLYTERHKHSQRSIKTGYLLFCMCERICTDTLWDPNCHTVMMLSTYPGNSLLIWLIKHWNYKRQYLCHLDTRDFSPRFLTHLGTCDTFIAGTCNIETLAESLFVSRLQISTVTAWKICCSSFAARPGKPANARSSVNMQKALQNYRLYL